MKAAWLAFEERTMAELKVEKPGLKKSQYKDMCWKLWQVRTTLEGEGAVAALQLLWRGLTKTQGHGFDNTCESLVCQVKPCEGRAIIMGPLVGCSAAAMLRKQLWGGPETGRGRSFQVGDGVRSAAVSCGGNIQVWLQLWQKLPGRNGPGLQQC